MAANGSSIAGASVCAAGLIGPVARPAAWIRAAVMPPPVETTMSLSDWIRQAGATIRAWSRMSKTSAAVDPVVSTQSGVRPICTAVELSSMIQPPGGSMLAKKLVRRASTSIVTLERSGATVVVTV